MLLFHAQARTVGPPFRHFDKGLSLVIDLIEEVIYRTFIHVEVKEWDKL